jgi:hypothetical protein
MTKLYKLISVFAFFTTVATSVFAQPIVESFNHPTQLFTTGGWIRQNLSTSANGNWFTGNPTVFPAYSGIDTTYAAANWSSTNALGLFPAAIISNWLITPTFTLSNGDVISFYTRTTVNPADYPDRLQLRMSTAGTSTNVGSTTTSVGDFTTVAVDVNPSLDLTSYPATWTQYSYTVTGLSAPTVGRFAFRYFCNDAGTLGSEGDFIGVDDFSYTSACVAPTVTANSGTICAGQSFTIAPSGATSFSYTGGSAVVSPTTTTSYTVTGFDTPGCEGTAVATVSVSALPTLTVNSGAICAGQSYTLNPGGASTFTISGGNAVVSPTATTDYTITGTSTEGCENSTVGSVTVNPLPVITVNSGTICAGQGFTISPLGAASYTISGGVSVVFPTTTTSYTVNGLSLENCASASDAISTVVVQNCTSIEEIGQNAKLNLFPNPFSSSFTLEIKSKLTISITDAFGKLILTEKFDSGVYQLDLSMYANGIYFVNAKSDQSVEVFKLIKE